MSGHMHWQASIPMAMVTLALAAQSPAHALTNPINWSFESANGMVSGTIEGLTLDQDNQAQDVIVKVTQVPRFTGNPQITFNYNHYLAGGFNVGRNGAVTADIAYRSFTPIRFGFEINNLRLASTFSSSFSQTKIAFTGLDFKSHRAATPILSIESLPAPQAVPGPLPIVGAAAAFSWSRALKRRCTRLNNSPIKEDGD